MATRGLSRTTTALRDELFALKESDTSHDLFGPCDDFTTDTPCGEECEVCLIPDEYKMSELAAQRIMTYLGISRAVPMSAETVQRS